MGGRAAENSFFREPTTGAVSTSAGHKIARAMVTEVRHERQLGAVRYGTEHGDPFLGRTMGTQADYSHEVARDIDDEVRKLIEAAHRGRGPSSPNTAMCWTCWPVNFWRRKPLHRAELEAIFANVNKRPRPPQVSMTSAGAFPPTSRRSRLRASLRSNGVSRGPPMPEPAFGEGHRAGHQQARAAAPRLRRAGPRTANGSGGPTKRDPGTASCYAA